MFKRARSPSAQSRQKSFKVDPLRSVPHLCTSNTRPVGREDPACASSRLSFACANTPREYPDPRGVLKRIGGVPSLSRASGPHDHCAHTTVLTPLCSRPLCSHHCAHTTVLTTTVLTTTRLCRSARARGRARCSAQGRAPRTRRRSGSAGRPRGWSLRARSVRRGRAGLRAGGRSSEALSSMESCRTEKAREGE